MDPFYILKNVNIALLLVLLGLKWITFGHQPYFEKQMDRGDADYADIYDFPPYPAPNYPPNNNSRGAGQMPAVNLGYSGQHVAAPLPAYPPIAAVLPSGAQPQSQPHDPHGSADAVDNLNRTTPASVTVNYTAYHPPEAYVYVATTAASIVANTTVTTTTTEVVTKYYATYPSMYKASKKTRRKTTPRYYPESESEGHVLGYQVRRQESNQDGSNDDYERPHYPKPATIRRRKMRRITTRRKRTSTKAPSGYGDLCPCRDGEDYMEVQFAQPRPKNNPAPKRRPDGYKSYGSRKSKKVEADVVEGDCLCDENPE